jgi:hypothetical protein
LRGWCAAALILAGAALQGCATNKPIPDGYTGPLATISDSAVAENSRRSRFFYLAEIDGRPVWDSRSGSKAANYGRGMNLTPGTLSREVPAQHVVLKLEGRVAYGAPILEIVNAATMYAADRTIEVDLEPSVTYAVVGQLTADVKDVWLMRVDTHERVGADVAEKQK